MRPPGGRLSDARRSKPLKKNQSELEDVNLLDLTPVRVAEWAEEGQVVVVTRPAPPKPWRAPLSWLSAAATTRRLRLDAVGSHAWRAMDGRRTVGEIADELSRVFGDEVEPATERLGMLVRTMHHESLIGYRGIDPIAGEW